MVSNRATVLVISLDPPPPQGPAVPLSQNLFFPSKVLGDVNRHVFPLSSVLHFAIAVECRGRSLCL
jgi:hypothetical protein